MKIGNGVKRAAEPGPSTETGPGELNLAAAADMYYHTALMVERIKARLGKSKYTPEQVEQEIKRVSGGIS